MADVVLFHHVRGLTDGVRHLADRLAGNEHTVHTPDLYGGEIGESIEEGFAIAERIGEEAMAATVDAVLGELPSELVYAGISMGVVRAQRLAQTRAGARGALLYEACIPITGEWAFGPWPEGVPVQIHGMDNDPFFAREGDVDAARELVAAVGPDTASLYTYSGDAHLFLDSSLPSFDAEATDLLVDRSRALLAQID